MSPRRVLAICIIICVAILPFVWNPWGTGSAQGAEAVPTPIQKVQKAQKMCPRGEQCYAIRLSNKFRDGKLGHSKRLVPRHIRIVLNRKYKGKVLNDWWNEPCVSTGWVCGGRYCQATKQFYLTQQCLDPGWYRSRPLTYTNKVILTCGGNAILGFIGGRLDSGKIGWWGAGIGAGSCLYKKIADRNGWGLG